LPKEPAAATVDRLLRVWPQGPDGLNMYFVKPGLLLPGELKDFPVNLEISVTKKGQDPAKITVKRDGEQWDVSADELEKLPKDIQPFVKQMLGGGGFWQQLGIGPQGQLKSQIQALPTPRLREFKLSLPDVREKVLKQLEETTSESGKVESKPDVGDVLKNIQRELKELRREVEELRRSRAKEKVDETSAG
jgi:hypothetical protein